MTDSIQLKALIEKKGLKFKYIADCLDISAYTLALKINNQREFKTSEIIKLCDVLEIRSLSQKENLFFKKQDD